MKLSENEQLILNKIETLYKKMDELFKILDHIDSRINEVIKMFKTVKKAMGFEDSNKNKKIFLDDKKRIIN